jgi:hypothetical protein
MNKRSAMAIAAGMVVALMVSASAVSIGLGGPGTASAGTAREAGKPVVRTVHRTVTVHKPAKGSPEARTVVLGSASAPESSASISEGDDQFEPESEGTDDSSGDQVESGDSSGTGGGDD